MLITLFILGPADILAAPSPKHSRVGSYRKSDTKDP